jgi:multiple sugar transport system substrate-binding protein
MVLPYPTFQGGEKVAMQRGGGMIVSKTDETRAYAAGIFLKWFTDPINNLHFVSSTGYLPVTEEAFGDIMTKEIDSIQDRNIQSLLRTSIKMQADYDFYIPPLFDGIDVLQENYSKELMSSAEHSRAEYQELLKNTDKDTAFREAVKDEFEKLQK